MSAVTQVLIGKGYLGMGYSTKALAGLMTRLLELEEKDRDKCELRMERAAIMWESGTPVMDAHAWMDSNPDLYGDIKTLEVLEP